MSVAVENKDGSCLCFPELRKSMMDLSAAERFPDRDLSKIAGFALAKFLKFS